MNTQRTEPPSTASDCLYPFETLQTAQGYPSERHFQVMRTRNGRSTGIKAKVAFDKRMSIAKVSGHVVGERRQHTLQMSSHIYLYDPWFSGLLRHSCDPNVFLDITELELWTTQAIHPGTLLTMDYASTENVLYQQFECHCGADNCRGWITGNKEPLNEEGQRFMEQRRQRKRV
ncbi:SET domain-containing protein-lysine N-methyltransferase [Pseudomonas mucidolens]|uniref:SET domain-containing protein-lysine N-methyltransferase n=1 Tax=Pseudomonas mucidolens TaxID=46679 RepID=UPI0030DAF7FC